MPNLKVLKKAYELTRRGEKNFTYITPRLSNRGIERLRGQLALLNDLGDIRIVVNDLGALNVLGGYPNLLPHLGRQLAFVPARCPWSNELIRDGGFLARRWVGKVFSSTSLNYELTVDFYRKFGVQGADVDWIPRIFPCFNSLSKMGLKLSIHLHLIPVIVTRRCHTARFLGEETPEECSKPCLRRTFLLKNDALKLDLFLNGNVVFNRTHPSPGEISKLRDNVAELIITMNPSVKIDTEQKINEIINSKVQF